MKKVFAIIFSLLLLATFAFSVVGCKKAEQAPAAPAPAAPAPAAPAPAAPAPAAPAPAAPAAK